MFSLEDCSASMVCWAQLHADPDTVSVCDERMLSDASMA